MADITDIIAELDPKLAPATWAQFTWPDWVPAKVRAEIESFWGAFGRAPANWLESSRSPYGARGGFPRLGARVEMRDIGPGDKRVTGRYVHCWNNIGRLIADDGTVQYVSGGALPPRPPPPSWKVDPKQKAFITEAGNLMRAGCHHAKCMTACGGCYARMQVLLDEVAAKPDQALDLVRQVSAAMKREARRG